MIAEHETSLLAGKQDLEAMVAYVSQAVTDGKPIHEVEEGLWRKLLKLGLLLLESFVEQQGHGNVGDTLELDNARIVKPLDQLHARRYVSIFGPMTIQRTVYGTRETQKFQVVPLDTRLELPESDFSYVLQKWDQAFCVRDSFAGAAESVETILGIGQSVRTLEHMNQSMASDVEDFRLTQPSPPPEEEATLMVVAADGKGVPMRRDAVHAGSGHRRHKGQKANTKRMACVGAAYTIEPFPRTVDEVVDEALHHVSETRRPVPQHKQVRADLTFEWEHEVFNGKDTLFAWLAEQVHARASHACSVVVCLMDGERALHKTALRYLPENTVYILDIYHAMEKLWHAAYCFHAEGSDEAAAFVEARLRMLLEGKVGYVVAGLRQMVTKRHLRGNKAQTIASVTGYLYGNRQRMKYDDYLAAGYPIGSGAVEGACRHLVKDRMERTGMHWRIEGAQAMLHLRATYLNGDWDAFCAHRTQQETQRLYPYRQTVNDMQWPTAA